MNPFATLPTLISTDRLCNLISYSQRAPEGLIAEFGMYKGGSLEILAKYNPTRSLFGIDSFQGLPPASEFDSHNEGEFNDVDHIGIVGYFKMLYPNVRILKGFSPDVFSFFDDHARFGFVHADIDMYWSVRHALDFFYPRLVEGGIMIFDDYGFSSTRGCRKAVDEWYYNCDANNCEEIVYADGVSSKQFIVVK